MKILLTLLLCTLMLSGCNEKPMESSKPKEVPGISTTAPAAIQADIPTFPATEQTSQPETAPPTESTWPFAEEPTPVTKPEDRIRFIVYSPNSNADGFYVNVMEWQICGESDYQPSLLEAWIELHVLTNDVHINSIIREESHITIDFNHAFKDLVCTMGTSGERMVVGSVVNTLIANYEVETVSITVDGETWESGHVIYDFPMGFYE